MLRYVHGRTCTPGNCNYLIKETVVRKPDTLRCKKPQQRKNRVGRVTPCGDHEVLTSTVNVPAVVLKTAEKAGGQAAVMAGEACQSKHTRTGFSLFHSGFEARFAPNTELAAQH